MTGPIPLKDYDDKKSEKKSVRIFTSAEFVAGFVPPDYVLDGILQRRFIYSFTAPTGAGKTAIMLRIAMHVAQGVNFGSREVERGRVLYFAGENPEDVKMRWTAMAEHLGFDVDTIDVRFIEGTFSIPEMEDCIREHVRETGDLTLVMVDTSAAYFGGSDENSNTEMGKHARILRRLTTLPGLPCVLVACHPPKGAGNDSLLPRGGGAFIAEVDGNLVAIKRDGVTDLHWQGKFRGPDFEAMGFRLDTVTSEALKDSRGRRIPTVIGHPVTDADRSDMQTNATRDEDRLILLLATGEFASLRGTAEALGWISKVGEPLKNKVSSMLVRLKREGLAEQTRGRWKLTAKGKQEAERLQEIRP